MHHQDTQQIINILNTPQVMRTPSELFIIASEEDVWQAAPAILDSISTSPALVRVLIRAVGSSFPLLTHREQAIGILRLALERSENSLLFAACQEELQRNFEHLDNANLRIIIQICLDRYDEQQNKDIFFAARALIAAVMLPLSQSNYRLLLRPLDTLINSFPSVPSDPSDSAELAVIALKLLGRCYEQAPEHSVQAADFISELRFSPNNAIAAEAQYQYGVVMLNKAFGAETSMQFFEDITRAHDAFSYTNGIQEQRSDAALFAAITNCIYSLAHASIEAVPVKELVEEARNLLIERWHMFGAGQYDPHLSLEYAFVQLLRDIEEWGKYVGKLAQASTLRIPLRSLAEVYARVRVATETRGILGQAAHTVEERILKRDIRGRFIQIQEISAKIANLQEEAELSDPLTGAETDFLRMLEDVLEDCTDPKAGAVVRLDAVRAAAMTIDPALATRLDTLPTSNLSEDSILLTFISQWIDQRLAMRSQRLVKPSSLAHQITAQIYGQLQAAFRMSNGDLESYFGLAAPYIKDLTELLSHYVVGLRQGSREELRRSRSGSSSELNFLFAKKIGGLGDRASEVDLQNDCYKFLRIVERTPSWFGRVGPEAIRGAPGRSDLQVVFPTDITLVIEVKCEDKDISRQAIHNKYVAQAQSYGAGTQRISFLLVLDTTEKDPLFPLISINDCCYVDQKKVPGELTPVGVIVFIVLANRYRPSDLGSS